MEALERALDEMSRRLASAQAQRGPRAMDAETEERLEALGYVGERRERAPPGGPARGAIPRTRSRSTTCSRNPRGASARKQYDEAIAMVGQALAADPEILEGHMLLGNYLDKSGRHEEAIAAYRRALALDPEHDESVFRLAVTYKDMGRLAEARVGFERAREIDPRNGKVLWQLADLDMRERRFDHAQKTLEEALALKIEAPRFLLKLGELHIEAKRYDEAEAALRQGPGRPAGARDRELQPGPRARGARRDPPRDGGLRGGAGRQPEGLPRELQPGQAPPEGRPSPRGRRPLPRRRVAITPEFGTGHLYLAKALLDLGDLDGAERAAREGLRVKADPEIAPLGHFVLADVLNRRGRPREAQQEAARARRLQNAPTSSNH